MNSPDDEAPLNTAALSQCLNEMEPLARAHVLYQHRLATLYPALTYHEACVAEQRAIHGWAAESPTVSAGLAEPASTILPPTFGIVDG